MPRPTRLPPFPGPATGMDGCDLNLISTVSERGLAIMTLLLLVVGKVSFGIRSRGWKPA